MQNRVNLLCTPVERGDLARSAGSNRSNDWEPHALALSESLDSLNLPAQPDVAVAALAAATVRRKYQLMDNAAEDERRRAAEEAARAEEANIRAHMAQRRIAVVDESKSTQAYLEKLKARHAASGFSDDPERVKMMKRQKALAARAAQWKSMRITRKWRLIKSHLLNVVAEREAEAFAAVEAAASADECVRMHAEDVYSRRVNLIMPLVDGWVQSGLWWARALQKPTSIPSSQDIVTATVGKGQSAALLLCVGSAAFGHHARNTVIDGLGSECVPTLYCYTASNVDCVNTVMLQPSVAKCDIIIVATSIDVSEQRTHDMSGLIDLLSGFTTAQSVNVDRRCLIGLGTLALHIVNAVLGNTPHTGDATAPRPELTITSARITNAIVTITAPHRRRSFQGDFASTSIATAAPIPPLDVDGAVFTPLMFNKQIPTKLALPSILPQSGDGASASLQSSSSRPGESGLLSSRADTPSSQRHSRRRSMMTNTPKSSRPVALNRRSSGGSTPSSVVSQPKRHSLKENTAKASRLQREFTFDQESLSNSTGSPDSFTTPVTVESVGKLSHGAEPIVTRAFNRRASLQSKWCLTIPLRNVTALPSSAPTTATVIATTVANSAPIAFADSSIAGCVVMGLGGEWIDPASSLECVAAQSYNHFDAPASIGDLYRSDAIASTARAFILTVKECILSVCKPKARATTLIDVSEPVLFASPALHQHSAVPDVADPAPASRTPGPITTRLGMSIHPSLPQQAVLASSLGGPVPKLGYLQERVKMQRPTVDHSSLFLYTKNVTSTLNTGSAPLGVVSPENPPEPHQSRPSVPVRARPTRPSTAKPRRPPVQSGRRISHGYTCEEVFDAVKRSGNEENRPKSARIFTRPDETRAQSGVPHRGRRYTELARELLADVCLTPEGDAHPISQFVSGGLENSVLRDHRVPIDVHMMWKPSAAAKPKGKSIPGEHLPSAFPDLLQ